MNILFDFRGTLDGNAFASHQEIEKVLSGLEELGCSFYVYSGDFFATQKLEKLFPAFEWTDASNFDSDDWKEREMSFIIDDEPWGYSWAEIRWPECEILDARDVLHLVEKAKLRVFKKCHCGRSYALKEWLKLKDIGSIEDELDDGTVTKVLCRNCVCDNTMAISEEDLDKAMGRAMEDV